VVSKQGRGDSKDKEDARKLGSGNREDTRETETKAQQWGQRGWERGGKGSREREKNRGPLSNGLHKFLAFYLFAYVSITSY
jgi:hypothetical protein